MRPVTLKSFVPLAIGGLLLFPNEQIHTFMYNDLEKNNISIVDKATLNHLSETQGANYTGLLLKIKFYNHLSAWEKKTKIYSFADQIVENEDFKSIVKLGPAVIPFIAQELSTKPSCLVWALNMIFEKKISNNETTTIAEASHLWLKFLNANNLA